MKKLILCLSIVSVMGFAVGCNRGGNDQKAESMSGAGTSTSQNQEERYPTTDSVGGDTSTEAAPTSSGQGTDAQMEEDMQSGQSGTMDSGSGTSTSPSTNQ